MHNATRMHCNIVDELPTLDQLMVLKCTDEGKRWKVRIVSEASHKWKTITSLICDDANSIGTEIF